jgi:hypothetical protein
MPLLNGFSRLDPLSRTDAERCDGCLVREQGMFWLKALACVRVRSLPVRLSGRKQGSWA